jgi:hypothetical protein
MTTSAAPAGSTRQRIDVWVDPACPFAWMTSQWLFEVERLRQIDVHFHTMSLSVLNQGKDNLSDFYRDLLDRAWGSVRVMIAAEQHDPSRIRGLYVELGRRIHNEQRDAAADVWEDALVAAGYPIELAKAAEDESLDTRLCESHHEGMDAVGYEVGTPVIHVEIDGRTSAYFGPVVTPAPQGDAAGRLWDGLMLMMSVDGFFELKRSRDVDFEFRDVQDSWRDGPA